ncbi:MAG TPA: EAL domain-containing protein [Acidimicrobiales bacterium]|nr:EAL domain-containing protein [Acidimicrobiales bacterium]
MTRAAQRRAGAGAPARPPAGPLPGLLVGAGVLFGIVVAAVTGLSWYRHDMRALESERVSEVDALVDGVRVRLDDIGTFVQGEAATYQGTRIPSQAEVNDQFALPDVLGREPGVIGEFYVARVGGSDLDAFVAQQEISVSPSFQVLPPGQRDEYWVVARAVPSSLSSMLGIDGKSVSVAAQALSQARDSGHAIASRTIPLSVGKLSADVGSRTIPRAIVVVTPVYVNGSTPTTVDDRRRELKGWAGVVVVGDLFARDLQRPTEQTLGLSLFDGGPEDRTTALVGVAPPDLLQTTSLTLGDVRTATVDSLGLHLTVRVTSLAAAPSPSSTAPLIVFISGLLLSLLAGSLAVVLVRSRRRALHLADDAIAEARFSEDEMRKSAARFASLVRRSTDVIAIVDPAGFVEFVTPSIERLLGTPPARVEGTCLFDYVVFDEQPVLRALLDAVMTTEEVATPAELVLLRTDGAKRWLEVRATNLTDDPNVGGIVLNGRDVTERRAFQDALTYEATHDRLTELPNRAQFLQILERAEERALGGGRSVAVLFIDIDHFKVVNDSLGHGVGDALLVAMARRLVGAVRASDPVARLGGDEFVVVCEGVDLAGAKMVAQHVLAACSAPFEIAGRELRITASVGIAVSEHANESAEVILRNADIAMYEAKAAGRACVRVFDDNARADIVRRLDTEHALHKAVERGELRLYYQPIVRLADSQVVGAEALLRWAHPHKGLLLPGEFLSVSEDSDLAVAIGEWVLEEAFSFLAEPDTRAKALSMFRLGINLSNRHLGHMGLPSRLDELARAHRVAPSTVSIEITESAAMADPGHVRKVLLAIRDQGFSLALDDFGTGYSSLSHVKRLPIDALKIDRAFVDGVTADRDDRAIVAAAVGLGEALDLQVVAEGVEMQVQARALQALGCQIGQGFLYSPAVTGDELLDLMDHAPLTVGGD